jgi:predicted nucleic acid-binding protein
LPLIRTYVDSGVLIWAAQGTTENAAIALPFLNDGSREYVTSDYIRLEVIPKSVFHANTIEHEFYEEFFSTNIRCINPSESLVEYAMEEGCKTGISGIDALHIACAVYAGADEFITTEKNTKPMHRTTLIKVTCIRPLENEAGIV